MPVFDGFPHVLESQQFSVRFLEELFSVADAIRSRPEQYFGRLINQTVAILFDQPSSRTFASFLLAAQRLGATVVPMEHMARFSSVTKGESLEDTIRMFLQYQTNYFIIRWDEEGSVARAAAVAGPEHPVINAGDGPGQHPTQALLDVYTIWRENHDLDRPIVVGLVGDLRRGRTVHSLVYLLGKLFPNISFFFISPESAPMKPEILQYLDRHERRYCQVTSPRLLECASTFDVLYMTRPQLNLEDDEETREQLIREYRPLILDHEIAEEMKPEAIILHPLPRTFELPVEVDANPRARYFEQMGNGLWLRMALLERIQNARVGLMAELQQDTVRP